jgi:hypothetical protein
MRGELNCLAPGLTFEPDHKEVTMKKRTSTIAALTIPLAIVCGLLVPAVSSGAEREMNGRACSNRSLSGRFGGVSTGVLLNVPGLPPEAQFRTVGATNFDGQGTFTGVEHTIVNGMPPTAPWISNSGTYSINPDCTGTMVLNTPGSPVPLTLGLVIVRDGKEIRTVLDSNAISGIAIKID